MRRAEEDGFRAFALSQAAALQRFAYLLCGDWHLAEDLVQATLIKLCGAWPRIVCTAYPVNYARRTLLRCWLDERRRPWRRAERSEGDLPDGIAAGADPAAREQADLRAELFGALSSVPPRQRAVLVLRYFESLSVAETARVLGCSEGTVKSQTARGLAAMKAALDARAVPEALGSEFA